MHAGAISASTTGGGVKRSSATSHREFESFLKIKPKWLVLNEDISQEFAVGTNNKFPSLKTLAAVDTFHVFAL